jgi:hypothetical protein
MRAGTGFYPLFPGPGFGEQQVTDYYCCNVVADAVCAAIPYHE